jgi:O-antigen ligase
MEGMLPVEYPADPEYRMANTDLEVPVDLHDGGFEIDPATSLDPPRSKVAGILLFLLYFLYSRTPDLIGAYVPGTVKALSAILLFAVIFGGGIKRAFSTRAVQWLTAFTFWLILSTPFSYWRGGSVQLLINDWSKAFLLTVATAGLIISPQYARKALVVIGLGTFQLAVLSVLLGGSGRLQFAEGLAGNPNDLALYLVMGIPGCLLLAATCQGWKRWFAWSEVLVLTVVALKTGSRMGLILLAILFFVLFLRQSAAGKAKLAIAALLISALGWSLTPQDLKDRYRTMWTNEDRQDTTADARKAIDSTVARQNLLQLGIQVALHHPILGVGPGEFGDYVGGEISIAREQRLGFRQTHNTYAQIASEVGFPALVFYLGALGTTIFGCFRLSKIFKQTPDHESIAATGGFLFLAAIVYACGIVFGSYAYSFFFPVIAGIAAGFQNAVNLEQLGLAKIEGKEEQVSLVNR